MRVNDITDSIITGAIAVHRALGPGLIESVYEACLEYELRRAGLRLERQKAFPVQYRGVAIDCGYRIDLVVEGCVVVELKVVDQLHPVHHAQLLMYLKLTGCPVGLLINFNVALLKDGVRRVVLGYKGPPPRTPRLRGDS